MTRADFLALEWTLHAASPLIRPPFPSPVIADPTFLPPGQTPDGRWHLFAHSLVGLHHYTSSDGLAWRKARTVGRNLLRPFLLRDGGGYVLYAEHTRLMLPVGVPWSSWIEARTTRDLERFDAPVTLLRPSLPWHVRGKSRAVSNPCVVRVGGEYRLYYSGGLVHLDDCGFDEPACIGLARGPTALGPFTPDPEPLLVASPGDPLANLGAGAMKVLAFDDGFIALQNGISRDAAGRTRSAIRALSSADGERFEVVKTILAPSGEGWMKSHVYALDCRLVGDTWRLYFNARNDWHWTKGREAIGLLTARSPAA